MNGRLAASILEGGDRVNAKAAKNVGRGPLWENTAAPVPPSRTPLTLYNLFLGFTRMRLGNYGMRLFFRGCLAALFLLVSTLGAAADEKGVKEINVAAAADLSAALKDVAADFEKKSGVRVKLSFGSSGALMQQIENGAPFSVFFSADMDYPRHLIAHGEAEASSLYRYAVGKVVLWVPADSPLDVERKGMNVLTDPSVQKISIADPKRAPYGKAAVAAMRHVGIFDQVSNRLVIAENVSQAAQFVESGNAQVGFVALAHAVSPAMQGKGKYWEIPVEAYPPLDQGVVVLSHAPHKKEAAAFMEFLKSKQAGDTLRACGFTLPEQK
jgi:molybdate transport system substrate-binding protein